METGLAVALLVSTYARIASRSGLAIRNFINIGVGVVDSDYRGEIKMVLSITLLKTLQSKQVTG